MASKHWKKGLRFFQGLENCTSIVPTLGNDVVKEPLNFFEVWGRKSLGAMIRDWWQVQFPEPTGPLYPWSDEEQEAVNRPDAVRICHRCTAPQEHPGWFCPECGAATGPYNNCMPFVNIFSTGEVLRAGIDKETRFAKWVYPTYFLFGAFECLIFFPLYWIRLIRAQIKRTECLSSLDHEDEN